MKTKKSTLTAEAELISRLMSIEKYIPVLEAQRQSVNVAEAELKRMIDEYEQARFNLFKSRLRREKRGWCTIDGHLVPPLRPQIPFHNRQAVAHEP